MEYGKCYRLFSIYTTERLHYNVNGICKMGNKVRITCPPPSPPTSCNNKHNIFVFIREKLVQLVCTNQTCNMTVYYELK